MRHLIVLLCLLPLSSQADIKVVTSIQPLYLITKSIMQGVAEPELLIKSSASVHDFAFKPSQMRRLKNADLVIWIDRNFESGFQKLPWIVSSNTETIELLRIPGLKQQEGHIWYSPTLILLIVEQIQSTLGRIDPLNARIYLRNSIQLSERVDTWGKKTYKQLMANKPQYLLDHDFFSHFEKYMNVKSVAVLHDTNEQPPSIRELQRIEDLLTRTPAKCLLHNEPGTSKLAQNIARKFSLPIYYIGQDSVDFMQGLQHISSTLLKCRQVIDLVE
jgi:zinc transport system substrate-binding protein